MRVEIPVSRGSEVVDGVPVFTWYGAHSVDTDWRIWRESPEGTGMAKATPNAIDEERTRRPVTVVQVPRAWVKDHGWPENFAAALAEATAGTPGFATVTRPQGELVMDGYRELDVAYLRKGPEGQAFLYVQAWRGAP